MVVPVMRAARALHRGGRIRLGQLDALAIDPVHRAQMDAVGADHFHMFPDCTCVGPDYSPAMMALVQRTKTGSDAGAGAGRHIRMNREGRIAAALALLLLAGCATQTGETVGAAAGAPGFLHGL